MLKTNEVFKFSTQTTLLQNNGRQHKLAGRIQFVAIFANKQVVLQKNMKKNGNNSLFVLVELKTNIRRKLLNLVKKFP